MMTEQQCKSFRLTTNFTLWEAIRSDTAIAIDAKSKNTRLMDIQRDIPEKYILNAKRLCENVLQPLRNELGMRVDISRVYSSEELNELVGGVSTSDHLLAMAADITVPIKQEMAFTFIRTKLKYKQAIYERKLINGVWVEWIHVSYDPFNLKQQALRTDDGKTYRTI